MASSLIKSHFETKLLAPSEEVLALSTYGKVYQPLCQLTAQCESGTIPVVFQYKHALQELT